MIHVGKTFDTYTGRIDDDAAIAYALATNDPNPIYEAGGAVPPLYMVSLLLPALHVAVSQSVDPVRSRAYVAACTASTMCTSTSRRARAWR